MPTYAYACTECEHRFDAQQAFTDAPLTECPECAGRLRKLFNAVGIVFKGSGFYRTDSRSKTSAGAGAKTSAGSSDSDSGTAVASSGSGSGDAAATKTSASTSKPAPAAVSAA